jgi:hypothetical protein
VKIVDRLIDRIAMRTAELVKQEIAQAIRNERVRNKIDEVEPIYDEHTGEV